MPSKREYDLEELLLEAHRKGIENAIDLAARTGTSLVIEENGIIKWIKPKYKYIRVPIQSREIRKKSSKNSSKRLKK